MRLIWVVVFLTAVSLATALEIEILSPVSQEYNTTLLPLSVNISEPYHSWSYSLNNGSNVTVCSFAPPETYIVTLNNGTVDSSWNLNGNNTAQIRFDKSIVPQLPYAGVEICFLLSDNDWQQENTFQFRVNDGGVYNITDDENLPTGDWTWKWKCAQINSTDFSGAYNITMWYSNHSLRYSDNFSIGGISLANNKATPGSSSYFSSNPLNNPPDASDQNISWTKYADDTDWMVNISLTTALQFCPLADTTTIQAELGNNSVTVYANVSINESANNTQTFSVMGARNITIAPNPVQFGKQVIITADVVASNITSVYALITNPEKSSAILPMLDDGLHDDGIAGDNIYGVAYNTTILGIYHVDVIASTPNTSSLSSSEFIACNTVFKILSPTENSTVNSTTVNITVSVPLNISSWGVSFDNQENVTVCSYIPPQNVNVNFTNGTLNSSWNLNGNNDGRINFLKSDLPTGKHTNVTFCFYLWDDDPEQEEKFLFRVNNGLTIYEIIDDELSIPAWNWNWVCKSIDPIDFSDSYAVNFWYSNRSTSGGISIAKDNSIPGVSSQWDNLSANAPETNNEDIYWTFYQSHIDWMITAQIEAEELQCPEFDSYEATLQPGNHTLTVSMENKSGIYNDTVNFEVIDIQNITIYPKSVKLGNEINITAKIFASYVQKVEAEIKPQLGSSTILPMFDDGLHDDGSAQDGVYGLSFLPTIANPYEVHIRATTTDNATVQKSKEFGAHHVRVAVVHSETTFIAGAQVQGPTEIEYIEWITSSQHELIMAGIPFDVIGEQDLLDLNIIKQYDALIFPIFQNVPASTKNEILNNLAVAQRNYGVGILASGPFMAYDENNSGVGDYSAMNAILNVGIGTKSADNAYVAIRVANASHPSARRFSQNEDIKYFNGTYYEEYLVYNASKQFAYPYNLYDFTTKTTVQNVIATENQGAKVFFIGMPQYAAESTLVRDGLLWILYGNNPYVGIKLTDKTAIWTARVDGDVSYETAQIKTVIPIYRDVMERNNLVGGWYIVNKHSFTSPIAWEQLRHDFLGMYNAGHEIGSHSYSHRPDINLLNDSDIFFEMYESKLEINKELGINIEGFVNPGEPPIQKRLWLIAQEAGYSYYSPLEDEYTKGFGYIDDTTDIINLQQNIHADYEWLVDYNFSADETTRLWIEQYNNYYRMGDGILIFSIWHDYPMDDYPDLFGNFTDYIATTDIESITPLAVTKRFLTWNKQDFLIPFNEVFSDSFEDCSGTTFTNWVQDSQNDWYCSTQRSISGLHSAEVNGVLGEDAIDATLTLKNAIALSEASSALLTFSWYIESSLDSGDYLALDLWDGTTWNQVASLNGASGNAAHEDVWHSETIDLNSYLTKEFKLRFRGTISINSSDYPGDANVDDVKIIKDPTIFDVTRTTPDAKFGQVTLPQGSFLTGILGASNVTPTQDNRSYVFTFENDTARVVYDVILYQYPIPTIFINENGTLSLQLRQFYVGNKTLSYTTNATFGYFDNLSGLLTWTPGFNESGNYSVWFSVTDGDYASFRRANITVLNTNRPPILDYIPPVNAYENETIAVSLNATDPDNMNSVANDDNIITYFSNDTRFNQTNNTFIWRTTFDDAGIYKFTFGVSDGFLNDTQEVTVNVTNVNRPPVLNQIGNKSINESETLIIQLNATDPDNDNLTFDTNAGSVISSLYLFNAATGLFNWTPAFGDEGIYTITFIVSDGSLEDSQNVTIIVLSTEINKNISLNAGWNLISMPLNLTNKTIPAPFKSIEGNYSKVISFDTSGVGNEWKIYDPGDSAASSLDLIDEKMGLWIKMINDDILKCKGFEPTTVEFNLKQGYNLIGYPSLNESNASTVFENIINDVDNILAYENGEWKSYDSNKTNEINTLATMKPGYGYWIKVYMDVNWTFNDTFS